ncbi:hypothetical protein DPSP01_013142 [Paraphaeosphaeria sporulosa]
MFSIIDFSNESGTISQVEINPADAMDQNIPTERLAARYNVQQFADSRPPTGSGAPTRTRAHTYGHSYSPYALSDLAGMHHRTSSLSSGYVPAQPHTPYGPPASLSAHGYWQWVPSPIPTELADYEQDSFLEDLLAPVARSRATSIAHSEATSMAPSYVGAPSSANSVVYSSRGSVSEMPPPARLRAPRVSRKKPSLPKQDAPEAAANQAAARKESAETKAMHKEVAEKVSAIPSQNHDAVPVRPCALTPRNLTDVEEKTNRENAYMFIANWERKSRPSFKRHDMNNYQVNDGPLEFNPIQSGHKLIDLELPVTMLIDCIFDSRNFETEDVFNSQVHADPLVELFLDIARAEILKEVRDQWRELRANDDKALRYQLDLLSKLYRMGSITPWKPIATYLEKWAYWRENWCGENSQERSKTQRPAIHPDDRFFRLNGSKGLQDSAEAKLKELLMGKGMAASAELYFMQRLKDVSKDVRAVIVERDSVLLLDTEGLETLLRLDKEQYEA